MIRAYFRGGNPIQRVLNPTSKPAPNIAIHRIPILRPSCEVRCGALTRRPTFVNTRLLGQGSFRQGRRAGSGVVEAVSNSAMNSDPPSTWMASRGTPQGKAHTPCAPIDVTLQSVSPCSPCSPCFSLSSDLGALNDYALNLVERNLITGPSVEFRRAPVVGFSMVTAKNSRKRREALSPAAATSAGTIADAPSATAPRGRDSTSTRSFESPSGNHGR